ncbi:MAG: HD domain-containing protein [Anaerolineales bacterium]
MMNQMLSSRFEGALILATRLHTNQVRKGARIPYVAHLLAVTALVLEDGGDEDQAIAALLHDAVEDQGGIETLDEIRRRFGERVAHIVLGCSDSFESPKPPWRERKENYLSHLREADIDILHVSLADKLHNACSILGDLQQHGDVIWERYKGGEDGTLWYYRSLVDVFREKDFSPMVGELQRVFNEIEGLTKRGE